MAYTDHILITALHSVLPKLQVDAVDFVFRYWRPGGKVMVGWGSFYRTGQY